MLRSTRISLLKLRFISLIRKISVLKYLHTPKQLLNASRLKLCVLTANFIFMFHFTPCGGG
jgi:hypothetical protein